MGRARSETSKMSGDPQSQRFPEGKFNRFDDIGIGDQPDGFRAFIQEISEKIHQLVGAHYIYHMKMTHQF